MIDKKLSSKVLAGLEQLGVSQQEAIVYISLLNQGGLSGYQLSKNACVHSSKIYGILQRLLARGFVIATDTRPVKYFASPPREVLENIEKDISCTIASLGPVLEGYCEADPNGSLVWNITGRTDVIHKAKEMIDAADSYIFMAVWSKELKPLIQRLYRAADRGVDLHIVIYGHTTFKKGIVYPHRPSDYPYRERRERRFVCTVDNCKAIIGDFVNDGIENGIWTESKGLVLLFRDFIIHEIYISKLEKAFPEEIQKFVGPNWEKMRFF